MMAFATKAAANLLPADVKEHPTFLTKDVEHQLVHTTLYIQVRQHCCIKSYVQFTCTSKSS